MSLFGRALFCNVSTEQWDDRNYVLQESWLGFSVIPFLTVKWSNQQMRSQDYYSERCTNFSVWRKCLFKNWRLLLWNMVDMFILKFILIVVKELNMENTVGIIRNNPPIILYIKIQSKKQANEWEKICNCDNDASSSIEKWRYHQHLDFLSLIWIAMKNLLTERGWKKLTLNYCWSLENKKELSMN